MGFCKTLSWVEFSLAALTLGADFGVLEVKVLAFTNPR
uniref:Uncharacterized protein n=1 Tax=Rhizophora mucronata TaxID=61149 RepID=A0A2P2P6A6_RHIMU